MNFLTPGVQFVSYAFFASILVFIIKVIFFRKVDDAYTFLLKWCLIGIALGIVAAYASCHLAHKFCLSDPKIGVTDEIPFWTTIAGLLVGMWFLTGRDQELKTEDADVE